MTQSSTKRSPEAPLLCPVMGPVHCFSTAKRPHPYVCLIGPRPVVGTKQDTEMDKAQQEQISFQDLQATAVGSVGDGGGRAGRKNCGLPRAGHIAGSWSLLDLKPLGRQASLAQICESTCH